VTGGCRKYLCAISIYRLRMGRHPPATRRPSTIVVYDPSTQDCALSPRQLTQRFFKYLSRLASLNEVLVVDDHGGYRPDAAVRVKFFAPAYLCREFVRF